jgi:hypothetical protein
VIAEKEFLSPGTPAGPGPEHPAEPPSPPLQVRQGGGPFSAGRSQRRRRSATPLPPPPVPAEMPDDTAGRVAFLALTPAPDVRREPAAEAPVVAPVAAPVARSSLEGWTAVALAAAVVVALFLLGMGLTR